MKKLGKKLDRQRETIKAYSADCPCNCSCNCSCSYSGMFSPYFAVSGKSISNNNVDVVAY